MQKEKIPLFFNLIRIAKHTYKQFIIIKILIYISIIAKTKMLYHLEKIIYIVKKIEKQKYD